MPIKPALLDAIRQNTYDKSNLDLSNQVITASEIGALFTALDTNTHITSIDFTRCCLGVNEAAVLAEGIKKNKKLRVLRLMGNDLGDKGAELIADAIKVSKSIKSLYIPHNDISNEGAKHLFNAACVNREIINIDLSFDHPAYKTMQSLTQQNRLLRQKRALNFFTGVLTKSAEAKLADSPAKERIPSLDKVVPDIADFVYGHGIFGQEKFWQKLQDTKVDLITCADFKVR